MLLKELEKIIKIVEKSEIAELEWEKNKERIRIRKDFAPNAPLMTYAASVPAPALAAATQTAPSAQPAAAAPAPAKPESKGKEVTSPFVGTFYASPSPTASKYVDRKSTRLNSSHT